MTDKRKQSEGKAEEQKNSMLKSSGKIETKKSNDILLNVSEAAAMCRMSRSMLYKLHAAGKTPGKIKFGRLSRWSRLELVDWIKAGCPDRSAWETMRHKKKRGSHGA